MAETIVLKEYQAMDIETCDLDKLQNFLKCHDLDKALKVTRHGVKANSWVGVLKYKNTQFQILPKLICDNENNQENILKNLIFMLSYTKKLNIKTSENAQLAASKNPFIEILIREYAKSLFDCLKRLTPKNYVREEDNLNYLKGKIKFSENIRHNSSNQAKFYCEFDEFSEDNILNQLFFFVSTCLFNISNDSNNKKLLKLIMNYFADIKLVRFDKFKARKIKLSRNQELFRKPFNLAKMFVEQTSVDLSKNKFENIALVWDMNVLFEEFIFEVMRQNQTALGCKVTAQKGKRLLVGDNSKKRNTFVDVMIKKGDEQIVLDTKYKKFVDSDSFSNGDVFQVSTYCLLHGARNAVLLYPEWNKSLRYDYYLNNGKNDYNITFKTVNLKHDNLKDKMPVLVKELQEILA